MISPPAPILALLAAIFWGGGDFSGGMGVKRAGGSLAAALRVVLLSHVTSFSLLAGTALLRHSPLPHGAPLAWSLATGLAGGFSVTAFYVALAEGAMGSAAAISGLLAAAIPALISYAIEGSPGPVSLAGFLLAAVSIWLIAAGVSAASRRALWLAVGSGAGFGVYFVCLRMSSRAGLLWPMCGSRFGSMSVCVAGIALTALRARSDRTSTLPSAHATNTSARSDFSPPRILTRAAILWALGTALFDTGGNLFFMAATRAGRLDVAAVLASLYPASTILLAAWLLHERPTRRQLTGMLVASVAVALIAL